MLRDGVKPAARVGRSRGVARQILENVDIPWSQQISVMFQIVCALALDVPEALQELELLRGVPPNSQSTCELWGHLNHADIDCVCLSSDQTGAYVHKLSVSSYSPDSSLVPLLPPAAAPADMSDMPAGPAPEAPSVGRDLPPDQASWLGALCITPCRSVWPVAVDYVHAMADWSFDDL